MPITKATASSIAPAAKGDLVVGSATNDAAVLGVGSNDQVLTADSSTATGLKWATASSGALTKITAGSFSAVASVEIDNCFTSTYTKYLIIWRCAASAAFIDLQMRFRYGGSSGTTQTSDYTYSGYYYDRNSAINGFGSGGNSSVLVLDPNLQATSDTSSESFGEIWLDCVGNTSEKPKYNGTGFGAHMQSLLAYAGNQGIGRTYTGFLFAASTGTITGTYAVYGVQN